MAALAFIINWIWQTFFLYSILCYQMAECFLSEREDTFTVPSNVRKREDDSCLYFSVGCSLPGLSTSDALCSQGFMEIDSSMDIVLGLP